MDHSCLNAHSYLFSSGIDHNTFPAVLDFTTREGTAKGETDREHSQSQRQCHVWTYFQPVAWPWHQA
jgi:hypothetical protein